MPVPCSPSMGHTHRIGEQEQAGPGGTGVAARTGVVQPPYLGGLRASGETGEKASSPLSSVVVEEGPPGGTHGPRLSSD